MAHPVITFPQPPPTSNTLTSHQRQQLLRSTRKLTKLLGSAPHLIDHDKSVPGMSQPIARSPLHSLSSPAVYLNLSHKLQSVSPPPSLSRRSHDIPRPPSPASSISSISTTTSKARHKPRLPSLSETRPLDSRVSKNRPPILRLPSPDEDFSQSVWSTIKLDTVPGSPPAVPEKDFPPASDVSDGDSTDRLPSPTSPTTPPMSRSYTLHVPHRNSISSPFTETSEPAFKITSEAATRRLKMERIRKRLGECVPVEAVFPHPSPDDVDEDGDYVQIFTEKEKPAQVNIDLRPRWKSSSAVVAFDVIYECPDEHGDEGLVNGLNFSSRAPKVPVTMSPRSSYTAPPRQSGKLVKRSRSSRVSETGKSSRSITPSSS